jgi:hypothetical protein
MALNLYFAIGPTQKTKLHFTTVIIFINVENAAFSIRIGHGIRTVVTLSIIYG